MLGKYTQSKWLKSEDLQGWEGPVQIQFVEEVTFEGQDRPPEVKIAMTFAEFPKPLILNRTNILVLQELFGDDADPKDMIGGSVYLFTTPTQTPQGTQTLGLRLKPVPKQGPPPTAAPTAPESRDEDAPPPGEDEIPF